MASTYLQDPLMQKMKVLAQFSTPSAQIFSVIEKYPPPFLAICPKSLQFRNSMRYTCLKSLSVHTFLLHFRHTKIFTHILERMGFGLDSNLGGIN